MRKSIIKHDSGRIYGQSPDPTLLQAACHAFADPYVEHDTLTLLLDLILLKRDVYRHLLFNRGRGERKVGRSGTAPEPNASPHRHASVQSPETKENPKAWERARERVRVVSMSEYSLPPPKFVFRVQARWYLIARLGMVLLVLDACTPSVAQPFVVLMYSVIRWTHLSTCASCPTTPHTHRSEQTLALMPLRRASPPGASRPYLASSASSSVAS